MRQEILPMTEWKRDTARALKRLRDTGEVQILTVNGRPAAVVIDPATYEKLLEDVEALRIDAAVTEALALKERGREGMSVDQAFARLDKSARTKGRRRKG